MLKTRTLDSNDLKGSFGTTDKRSTQQCQKFNLMSDMKTHATDINNF